MNALTEIMEWFCWRLFWLAEAHWLLQPLTIPGIAVSYLAAACRRRSDLPAEEPIHTYFVEED